MKTILLTVNEISRVESYLRSLKLSYTTEFNPSSQMYSIKSRDASTIALVQSKINQLRSM